MATDPRQHPLRCQCGTCKTPFAFVQNGALVIVARHNGEKHTNILPLTQVVQLLQQEGAV
jgi:hypothetical protein